MNRAKPSQGNRSALNRERMQFVVAIARLLVEAMKMLHGWLSGGDGPGWPTIW